MNPILKSLREDSNLTLQELADMCGLSKSGIYELESGKNDSPSLTSAYAISKVLGKSVYDVWPDQTEIEEVTVTVRRVVVRNKAKHSAATKERS